MFSTKGLVASSQALASQAGLEILNKGGNAGEQLKTELSWQRDAHFSIHYSRCGRCYWYVPQIREFVCVMLTLPLETQLPL